MSRYAPGMWTVQPLGVWYLSLSAAEQHARNLVREGHYTETSVTGADGDTAYVVSRDIDGSIIESRYV